MNYIVFDLEFNQAYTKKSSYTHNDSLCPFEIIQLGAIKINHQFDKIGEFHTFVQPQIYTKMHPYVEKITGITSASLKSSPFFPEVYVSFLKFIGNKDESVLCTWGKDDMKALYRNILYHHLDEKLLANQYINIQTQASLKLDCEKGQSIGLKHAVELFQLPVKNEFHDALFDAEYTAEVFRVIQPETIKPTYYQVADAVLQKEYKRMNTDRLFHYFRKKLGRPLTPEEEFLIKNSYELGRNNRFPLDRKSKNV